MVVLIVSAISCCCCSRLHSHVDIVSVDVDDVDVVDVVDVVEVDVGVDVGVVVKQRRPFTC